MSMPQSFPNDPNSFPGPPPDSSNTTRILVAIAIVCGTLMLVCGGLIFGIVMTVRQAQRNFEDLVMQDEAWETASEGAYQEYARFVAAGRYSEALESVNSDLDALPDSDYHHNNKAWLLATCPDDTLRDGQLAVKHATKACELSDWNRAMFLDTLAAAYAEAGDFESAVKWQQEAIRLDDGTEGFQERLRMFEAGDVYREGVPPYLGDEPSSDESPYATEDGDAPAIESSEPTTTNEEIN